MSADPKDLRANKLTFFSLFRQNTGRQLCDSGDFYGRGYDKPPEGPDSPAVRLNCWKRKDGSWGDVTATLVTELYLDSRYKIDRKLQRLFDVWESKHADLSWFEAGQEFMIANGYICLTRDNTCNDGDNDLSQNFVFEVWKLENQKRNGDHGIYAVPGLVAAIYAHTGCDVRGGYSKPCFCTPISDYAIPVDTNVGFTIVGGRKGSRKLTDEERHELDKTWQVGYCGSPSYQMNARIEKVTRVDMKNQVFWAVLKTGEHVKVMPYWNEE